MTDLNFYTLSVFAPLLIVVGVFGFILPEKKSLTSGAPAYNVFHIVSGLLALALLYLNCDGCVRGFNIGFGLVDLYQAAASFLGWFPKAQFRWKPADDILHIAIGLILVVIGVFGS